MVTDSGIRPSEVVVVVLNYCGADYSIDCINSLQKMVERPLDIIVVDNNSPDDSVQRMQAALSGVTLLLSPDNNGYAAGNNIGIRHALANRHCKAVWILNNDTEVAQTSLDELCACLNADSRVGIAGATLCSMHDRKHVQCCGGLTLNPLLGTTAFWGSGSSAKDVTPKQASTDLDFISGACLLVRREVFERVGLLPEEYFMYYEDADFGLAARRVGFRLAWAENAVVWHREGGSTGASDTERGREARPVWVDYLELRNRIWLARKYDWRIVPLVCVSYVFVILRRMLRGQAKRTTLVLRALWAGLSGKMGKPERFLSGSVVVK